MTYTVKQVCEHFGVGENTVLGWIRDGELRAINVGRSPNGKKPRHRVTQQALEAFELCRTTSPPPTQTRRRRKPANVIEYYK